MQFFFFFLSTLSFFFVFFGFFFSSHHNKGNSQLCGLISNRWISVYRPKKKKDEFLFWICYYIIVTSHVGVLGCACKIQNPKKKEKKNILIVFLIDFGPPLTCIKWSDFGQSLYFRPKKGKWHSRCLFIKSRC